MRAGSNPRNVAAAVTLLPLLLSVRRMPPFQPLIQRPPLRFRFTLSALLLLLAFSCFPVTAQWSRLVGPKIPFDRFVNSIATTDNGHVFAGGYNGLFRSTDGGATWSQNTSPGPVEDLALDSSGNILAGTYYGVYRSSDGGETWNSLTLQAQIRTFAVLSPDTLLAGGPSGIFRSTDGGSTWTIGVTVYVNDIAVAPNGYVYAGTSNGIYRSTDGGTTWNQSGQAGWWVAAITVDSAGRVFGASGVLYRSTDQGGTWIQLSPQGINALAVSDSGIVYAGGLGIHYSLDGGTSWSLVEIPGRSVHALAFGDSAKVYAATDAGVYHFLHSFPEADSTSMNVPTYALARGDSNAVFAGTSDGAFRSANGGTVWNRSGLTGKHVLSFAIGPYGKMFAGTDSSIFRSTDGGQTWDTQTLVNRTTSSLVIKDSSTIFAGGPSGLFRSTDGGSTWAQKHSYVTRGIVLSNAGNVVIGTNSGTWMSTDNGETWTFAIASGDIKCLAKDPFGRMWASGEYGLRRSTDGVSWSLTNFSMRGQALAFDSSVMLMAVGTEVLRSTNFGIDWATIGNAGSQVHALLVLDSVLLAGTENGTVIMISESPGWIGLQTGILDGSSAPYAGLLVISLDKLLIGTTYGVYRSTDGSLTWTKSLSSSGIISALVRDSSGTIFAGGDAVYRSTDGGGSWNSVLGGVTVRSLAAAAGNVWAADWSNVYHSSDNGTSWRIMNYVSYQINSLSCANPGMVFAGADNGVFRSSDRGISWERAGPATMVLSLTRTASGALFAATMGGVHRTTDNGDSWTIFTNELSGKSVSAVGEVQAPFLLAASTNGIHASADGAASWVSFGEGFDSLVQVNAIGENGAYLYLASNRGIWRRSSAELATTGIPAEVQIPASLALEQNYPNPFNPATTIQFTLHTSLFSTLKVYDILGREVAVLVNEEMPPGVHKVEWHASAASGVYFYVLEALGRDGTRFVRTRKMVIVR